MTRSQSRLNAELTRSGGFWIVFSRIHRWRWVLLAALIGFVYPFAYADWTDELLYVDGLGPSFSVQTPPLAFGPYRLELVIWTPDISETGSYETDLLNDVTISLQSDSTVDFSNHMHCQRNPEMIHCRSNRDIFLVPWSREIVTVSIALIDAPIRFRMLRPGYPGPSQLLWAAGVLCALCGVGVVLTLRFLKGVVCRRKSTETGSDANAS